MSVDVSQTSDGRLYLTVDTPLVRARLIRHRSGRWKEIECDFKHPPPPKPSDRLGGLRRGAKGLVDVARGIDKTPPEIARHRMNLCRGCPHDCYVRSTMSCNAAKGGCGCFLPAKVRKAAEACPMGVWGPTKPVE